MFLSAFSPRSAKVSSSLSRTLLVSRTGQTYAPWLRDALQPRGDIDAVAEQIAVGLRHHVADVDADPEFDPFVRVDAGVQRDHAALDIQGAASRVDNAAELDQQTIAHGFENPTAIRGDGGVNPVCAQFGEAARGPVFVKPGQTREANDVGGKDRSQLTVDPFRRHSIPTKPPRCRKLYRPSLPEWKAKPAFNRG
jgi:hypothetical protein